MSARISDPDVRMLAAISGTLHHEYETEEDPWHGSPFAWIKQQQSRQRGKIGEQLVSGLLAANGFDIARSGDTEADRLVNGTRVEIKFSTLWKAGVYKFQQVRDQDYSLMICLGISPFDAHRWAIPKTILLKHVIGVLGQHSGARGRDTAWMSFTPDHPYPWLEGCGGRLRSAIEAIRRHVGD